MPPRKKVVPVAKEAPIQEMPVVFFLRIEETEDDNVVPAGIESEYSDIGKTAQTTN